MEEEKGLSLADTIKVFKGFLLELKKNRFWVFLILFLAISVGCVFSYLSKPKYVALSTMMLESSKGGGNMSGALALASQFGLLSSGGNSAMNEDKLLDIIKAETIVKSALFQKVKIGDSTDVLANHFLNLVSGREKWKGIDSLRNFKFVNSKDSLTRLENTVG